MIQFLGLLVLVTLFIVPIALGAWILRPLDLAARQRDHAIQFTMIDFLGLIFLIQLPMAGLQLLGPQSSSYSSVASQPWGLYVLGSIVSAAVWAVAVSTFSRAGIRDYRDRGILVFGVLPVAYAGSFAVVIVPVVWAASPRSFARLSLTGVFIIMVALLAAIVAAGLATRRIVRRKDAEEDT